MMVGLLVAYLDYQNSADIEVEGFADLGEVAFIRLEENWNKRICICWLLSK